MTPNSFSRPWLLYESGFVAGKRGSEVVPLVFKIEKSQLPFPLSSYVIYSGDKLEDLERLLIQLLSEIVPKPNRELINNELNS